MPSVFVVNMVADLLLVISPFTMDPFLSHPSEYNPTVNVSSEDKPPQLLLSLWLLSEPTGNSFLLSPEA